MVTMQAQGAVLGRRAVTLGLAAALGGTVLAAGGQAGMADAAFTVRFDAGMRADLLRRLEETRWSDAVTADWQYGMDRGFLQSLVQFWRTGYDFDAAEARLNAAPQFRASVDGFGIHYVHVKGRGKRVRPLLLMNGWPSSFVEYRKLAPMLADPAAFGGDESEAFDVVMPALPGFGFSDRPVRPHQVWAEDVFHRLMTDHLGYDGYVAAGTDIGAGVATRLALKHPEVVRGIHVSAVVDPPVVTGALSDAELAYRAQGAAWEAAEGAYEHVHYTKPQTLAFALADSPVGLASWIGEKFHAWSEHGADLFATFPAEMLIDTLMVYWATETIGSSMRVYYDHAHFRGALRAGDRVRVPTAVCLWPKDLVTPPREWAARFYDLRQYAVQAHGGHFPAWEAPEAYAADLRRFAAGLA
jgi:microsomal epoxide hydrolase